MLVVFSISQLLRWWLVIVYNYGLHLHRCGGVVAWMLLLFCTADRYLWTWWLLNDNPYGLFLGSAAGQPTLSTR